MRGSGHTLQGNDVAELADEAAVRETFAKLRPVTPEYATAPILEGFNWSDCVAELPSGSWYLVCFRSIHSANADEEVLTEYDNRAFAAAKAAGGLLHYFQGEPNARGACLSFCLWQTLAQARAASAMPEHVLAAHIVGQMYDQYVLERYMLTKPERSLELHWHAVT